MAQDLSGPYFLDGAIIYIDDTVIYGADLESFQTILHRGGVRMVAFNF
jgi:hypothetical protein